MLQVAGVVLIFAALLGGFAAVGPGELAAADAYDEVSDEGQPVAPWVVDAGRACRLG